MICTFIRPCWSYMMMPVGCEPRVTTACCPPSIVTRRQVPMNGLRSSSCDLPCARTAAESATTTARTDPIARNRLFRMVIDHLPPKDTKDTEDTEDTEEEEEIEATAQRNYVE